MKIFVLAGQARCGKDILGKYMKEKFDVNNENACILHFTTPLYEYAKNYFSWNGDIDEKPREFLQEMGIEVIQKKLGLKNFLVDRLCSDIEILKNFFDVFIIADGRMINEFNELKKRYEDTKIIHIVRYDYDDGLTDKEKSHITECEVNDYDGFDYTIYNTSLDDLYKQADEIVYENMEEVI